MITLWWWKWVVSWEYSLYSWRVPTDGISWAHWVSTFQIKSSEEMAASSYFHVIRKEPVWFQGRYLAWGHRVSKPELLDLNSVLFLHLTASSEVGFRFLERLGCGERKSRVTPPGVADTGTFVSGWRPTSPFAFLSVICCTWPAAEL